MSLREHIARMWAKAPRPLRRIWNWARDPDKPGRKAERFDAAKDWSADKRDKARQDDLNRKAKEWAEKTGIYRSREEFWKKRKKFLDAHNDPAPAPTSAIGVWNGRQVAGWMVGTAPGPGGTRRNWLQEIDAAGWNGGLFSGWRSPAYSTSLCFGICGSSTCPGLCAGASSQHAGSVYPGGAIDVDDWVNFERANQQVGGPFHTSILPNDRPHHSVSGS